MHTDGAHHRTPPRCVVMRCIDPGTAPCATLVLRHGDVELTDREWHAFGRIVWRMSDGRSGFLAQSRLGVNGWEGLRYDIGCMRIAHPSFDEAHQRFAEALLQAPRQR